MRRLLLGFFIFLGFVLPLSSGAMHFLPFGQFIVSTAPFAASLVAEESTSTTFTFSVNRNGCNSQTGSCFPMLFPNDVVPYYFSLVPHCNTKDDSGSCTETAPDLCPYIQPLPTDEIIAERDSSPNSGQGAFPPSDPDDTWNMSLTAPCFDSECPADYDSAKYGAPLPIALKGKEFKCDVAVMPAGQTPENSVPVSYTGTSTPPNVFQVSATLKGSDKPLCCSSVAFIPGIEGSRLFKTGILANTELWEPLLTSHVQDLFLDSNGKSINSNIFVDGVIDQAVLPIVGPKIYQSFIDEMNGMTADGTIAGWKPLAYDWRLDWNSVVDDGAKQRDGSVENMVAEIEKLAAASKTGKVTIVAHSMGGLISKVVIDRLAKKGEEGLIDKLVDVAVPELGTPAAIGSILHGSGGGIGAFGFNFLLSDATARGLAANAPGAYGLLPSAEYFSKVADPVVEFDLSTAPISNLSASYGKEISSSAVLSDFLTAGTDHRAEPDAGDLVDPLVANSALLANAAALHSQLDTMAIPENIQVTQVAGCGLSTVRGVKYVAKNERKCGEKGGLWSCSLEPVLDNQPMFVEDGDGTVVTPSATAMNGDDYYLDLHAFNASGFHLDHKDIFEVPAILDFVKNKIIGSTTTPIFISKTQPPPDPTQKTIRLSIHSPATIDLYDDQGRHTGPIPNPNPNSDLQLYEANIPNSYYMPFGEGKYAGYDASASTTVKIHGTGGGTFTIKVEQDTADVPDALYTYNDIPVSTSTEASFSISSGTSTPIVVDENGDGTKVFSVRPQADDGSDTPNPDIPVEATTTPDTTATSTPDAVATTTPATPAPSPSVANGSSYISGGGGGRGGVMISVISSTVASASATSTAVIANPSVFASEARQSSVASASVVVPGVTRDPGLHPVSPVIVSGVKQSSESASSSVLLPATSGNPGLQSASVVSDAQLAAIQEAEKNRSVSNILFASAAAVAALGALFLGRRYFKS